ncbi:DUF5009 domain-containing protein [Asticcacaulis sp. 201]|uniref:DUF5009 domain-containing protein n=1 Tax=Asticcacaulis sp. 201 TaxID=3028787 RepID=UPI0029163998|nr:DUF5009 domain-containing protein [Asticcacaulis sp. 201]MDV6329606.1 DUF5009 domain-containing protein [Asticcacaulis sp. 201]
MAQAATSDGVTRVGAIDVLRALTMVLMIFVNDLGSLTNIPTWLDHVERNVDGMGLADIVFPAFLFIVGMSLPFATDSRRARGETDLTLIWHVILRSIALLVLGVFLVNGETIDPAASGITQIMWNFLVSLCAILIWNVYPKSVSVWIQRLLKACGIVGLIIMAVVYRGDGGVLFATQWWGILGLIGWSYLVAGFVTVLSKGRLWVLVVAWLLLVCLSFVWASGQVHGPLRILPEALIDGTMGALTLGGVVMGTLFKMYQAKADNRKMTVVFLILALGLIGLGIYTRQFWGISKLRATPAWLFICSAITIIAFTAVYWMNTKKPMAKAFTLIKPAGTDTLLCYLTPSILAAATVSLPQLADILMTGGIGLIKSLMLAFVCVGLTACLTRIGIRLKL